MSHRKYPVCSQCNHTLNPDVEDGCDRYAMIGGEIYCEYCLADYLKDEVGERPFDIADALKIPIFEVMRREDI